MKSGHEGLDPDDDDDDRDHDDDVVPGAAAFGLIASDPNGPAGGSAGSARLPARRASAGRSVRWR
jgi:hypothetical protein